MALHNKHYKRTVYLLVPYKLTRMVSSDDICLDATLRVPLFPKFFQPPHSRFRPRKLSLDKASAVRWSRWGDHGQMYCWNSVKVSKHPG
jgi:hypothetical protein